MTGSTGILAFIVCVICASVLAAYGHYVFGYVVLGSGGVVALAGIAAGDRGVV